MPGPRNPLKEGARVVSTRMAGPASYTTGGNTWRFRECRNVRRITKIVHDPDAALGGGDLMYVPLVVANNGQGNTRVVQVFTFQLGGAWAEVGNGVNISAVNFIVEGEIAEGV